jgi:hypothetical protein
MSPRVGLGLVLALAAWPGCVVRTLQVRSAPSGARVFLNAREVGVTPLDHPFDHYGTVAIRLVKEGHVPHDGELRLAIPWYEWFPLDFVSEVLWPGTIRDVHTYAVGLDPLPSGDAAKAADEALLRRAEAARAAGELPK